MKSLDRIFENKSGMKWGAREGFDDTVDKILRLAFHGSACWDPDLLIYLPIFECGAFQSRLEFAQQPAAFTRFNGDAEAV